MLNLALAQLKVSCISFYSKDVNMELCENGSMASSFESANETLASPNNNNNNVCLIFSN